MTKTIFQNKIEIMKAAISRRHQLQLADKCTRRMDVYTFLSMGRL